MHKDLKDYIALSSVEWLATHLRVGSLGPGTREGRVPVQRQYHLSSFMEIPTRCLTHGYLALVSNGTAQLGRYVRAYIAGRRKYYVIGRC